MTQENERNWRSYRNYSEDGTRASRNNWNANDSNDNWGTGGWFGKSREYWGDDKFHNQTIYVSSADGVTSECREARRNANDKGQSQTICSPGVDDAPSERQKKFWDDEISFQTEEICSPCVNVSRRWRREETSSVTRFTCGVQRRGRRAEEERWILFVDGVDFCFNWIPAGKFSMGFDVNEQRQGCGECKKCASDCAASDEKASTFGSRTGKTMGCFPVPDSEASKRRVALTRDFWLMDTPVTVAAFDVFLKATGRPVSNGAFGYDAETAELKWDNNCNFSNPGFPDFSESRYKNCYPATCVDWKEAVEFCAWLTEEMKERRRGARTVLEFRLPTEAEWERACRAETTTSYFFGDEKKRLAAFGNFDGIDGYDYISPVRRFWPNDYGLYDMHGNIWEWCDDWYAPYASSWPWGVARNPNGPEHSVWRTVRGGAWNCAAEHCRSATRGAAEPWVRSVNLGFRVAMDVYEY